MEHKIHIHRQYEASKQEQMPIESKRRTLLKYVLFGSGSFMLGKIFGPSISLFSSSSEFSSTTDFQNFRVVESGKELQFFDKMGNEILTLDKEA